MFLSFYTGLYKIDLKIYSKCLHLYYPNRAKNKTMKLNKQILVALGMMVALSALYRVMPNRPMGFAPQIAIALFGGSLFRKQKQYAFFLPLISMFLSDLLYQFLFINHLSPYEGFYAGQLVNYLLIAGTTIFGFGLQSDRLSKYSINFIAAPTVYFFLSNFVVWANHGGYQHPKTLAGLIQTMIDGIPFYPNSVASTLVFGAILFGAFRLMVPKFKAI